MKQRKNIVARTAGELAEVLGLSPLDGLEMEVRTELNTRIIQIVQRSGLTHAQVAKAARTSRSRVTAILNRDTHDVSTDLLLRIVASLGYHARITVRRNRSAA
ncbi:MAG TPA: XRE family transcriptional regulator [Tepidisphaeraceae bacterium]|jgi:predicted XRE-type DNA-binding protein|nr:XRE family transcriptional regulator [Tepidisphaeraceae bacterium]